MTIIIPYKRDIFDGLELKYCLRAIQKYLTGYTGVVLIGIPPDWYKGDYVLAPDFDGRKQYSIYQKLLTACEYCTENFPMFNDDHFLLKPLHADEIKYWYNHTLKEELNLDLTARYRQTVFGTYKIFPNGLNFDIHTPIIYNKEKFTELFKDRKDELCIKSFYCNSVHAEPVKEKDIKINNIMPYEMIKERIAGSTFFSTGTTAIKPPMIKLLNELYPEKSKWEK